MVCTHLPVGMDRLPKFSVFYGNAKKQGSVHTGACTHSYFELVMAAARQAGHSFPSCELRSQH